jgi:hypothetical protein
VIDCTVRNLSDGGALLLVNSLIGIPDSFELTIDSDSTTCGQCYVEARKPARREIRVREIAYANVTCGVDSRESEST